jgi:hypothetical protein
LNSNFFWNDYCSGWVQQAVANKDNINRQPVQMEKTMPVASKIRKTKPKPVSPRVSPDVSELIRLILVLQQPTEAHR